MPSPFIDNLCIELNHSNNPLLADFSISKRSICGPYSSPFQSPTPTSQLVIGNCPWNHLWERMQINGHQLDDGMPVDIVIPHINWTYQITSK